MASSQGLYHFDLQTEQFTYRFQHDEINPDSLSADSPAPREVHFVAPENAALPLSDDAARISNPELRDAFLRAAGKCLERRAK